MWLNTPGAGATPGATMKVSLLKIPMKSPTPTPCESVLNIALIPGESEGHSHLGFEDVKRGVRRQVPELDVHVFADFAGRCHGDAALRTARQFAAVAEGTIAKTTVLPLASAPRGCIPSIIAPAIAQLASFWCGSPMCFFEHAFLPYVRSKAGTK